MLKPKKSLGQNFLRDGNTARKIVAALQCDSDDPVVEIGPGTGALTGILAERFRRLTAIEIDERAVELLKSDLPSVDVLHGNVMDLDWGEMASKLGGPIHVIGNLPYNITSQILFGLLDATGAVREAVLMMQYEVAQRLVARPSTRAYGILSVAVQQVSRPKLLFPVSRNVFFPKPDVRSAVIRLEFPGDVPFPQDIDPRWVRRVVRTAFNQRRKTLRNSLKLLCQEIGRDLPEATRRRRAEELTPEEFIDLGRYLQSGS